MIEQNQSLSDFDATWKRERVNIPVARPFAHDPIPLSHMAAMAAWLCGDGPLPDPYPLTNVRYLTAEEIEALSHEY